MGSAQTRAAIWAGLAAVLFTGWQWLTVTRNFQGNWTALFCTGYQQRVPPSLDGGTYRVGSATGYDGQMYRYVAHDPFLRGEEHRYIDSPALRTSRILVPGMAWLLALGQQRWIDTAYILLFSVFCFGGAYWTGLYLMVHGVAPRCCLLFLLLPATIIATDRLVVDMAFCALMAALVWYAHAGKLWGVFCALLLLCLCRETGLIPLSAFVAAALFCRQWSRAAIFSAAALPTIAWYGYVHQKIPSGTATTAGLLWERLGNPGEIGPIYWLLHAFPYPFVHWIALLAQTLDRLAILGTLVAFVLAISYGVQRIKDPLHLMALLFAASAALALNPYFWQDDHNYGRVFSPLLLILALHGAGVTQHRWLWLLPVALVDLRILLQLSPQILGVVGFHVAQ